MLSDSGIGIAQAWATEALGFARLSGLHRTLPQTADDRSDAVVNARQGEVHPGALVHLTPHRDEWHAEADHTAEQNVFLTTNRLRVFPG